MPIVIDRKTGGITSSQKLGPKQNQLAWEQILRTYVNNHPEVLSDEKIKGEAS